MVAPCSSINYRISFPGVGRSSVFNTNIVFCLDQADLAESLAQALQSFSVQASLTIHVFRYTFYRAIGSVFTKERRHSGFKHTIFSLLNQLFLNNPFNPCHETCLFNMSHQFFGSFS